MGRFHKLCNILHFSTYYYLFHQYLHLITMLIELPILSKTLIKNWPFFSTKTKELNVSVAVACGRHFESLFPSARRRRFHQARAIYYSNSCATFHLEYLLTCGDVQANPAPCRNSTGRPCSDNHRTSKNILRCMSLNARSICNKLNEFHDLMKMKKWAWL